MDLELYSLLSTVIAAATGATVIIAVLAYLLFRVRERSGGARHTSRPQAAPAIRAELVPDPGVKSRFFKRYQPAGNYELKN